MNPDYLFGSEPGETAANGLEFADGSQALADVEGREVSVKLARFLRDPATGQTKVHITDETVVLGDGFVSFDSPSAIITLDGVPLVLVDGEGVLPNGQSVWSYMNYAMTHSGTGALYTYARFQDESAVADALDMEGFFAFGFESEPDTIALLSGAVDYKGSYFGYGQRLDAAGVVLDDEVRTIGAISLTADFDRDMVSGRLDGFFDPAGENTPYLMAFFDAAIVGNGFAAAPDMICERAVSCSSASSLGAVFYGPGGEELSGVIGFDETIDPSGPEPATRFVGAAGFSAGQMAE